MFSRGHNSQTGGSGNATQPPRTGSHEVQNGSSSGQTGGHVPGAHAGESRQSDRLVQQVRSMLDIDEPVNTAGQQHISGQQRRGPHNEEAMATSSGRTEERHQNTTVAPTVTHETIQPVKHEIIEERITRDIHTHEVRHVIQPVYEVEVRPARHYVPGPDGKLVEVSEKDLPDCTGANQRWYAGQQEPATDPALSKPLPDLPTVENTGERTAGGFQRTEETIVHSPKWAKATSDRTG